jgi:RHS repeat-associated protein
MADPSTGQLLARQDARTGTNSHGWTSWYLYDTRGNVADDAGSKAAVEDHVDYSAFGTPTDSNAGLGDRFKFAGMEFDQETSNYHDGARYYSPSAGRFISQDPIGFAGGDANTYRYVGNGPTDAIDPSGLDDSDWYIGGYANPLNWFPAGVPEGTVQGLGHGTAMVANAFTGGFIGPLNNYVDQTIAENGGAYGVANVGANVSAFAVSLIEGYGAYKAGVGAINTGANAIRSGVAITRGGRAALAGIGTVRTGQAVVGGAQIIRGGGQVIIGGGLAIGGAALPAIGGVGALGSLCALSTGSGSGRGGAPDSGPNFTKEMLSQSEVIARGPGIRKIDELVEKFGGTRKGWVKKKGVDSSGKEWHWYEHSGIGRVGVKRPGDPDPF